MTKRPLMQQPLGSAVALLGEAYLREAAAALKRQAAGDAEGLHDVRVALRRLRSLLRAYRDELEDILPRKLFKAVRGLGRITTPARDREVQLAWLGKQGKGLTRQERVGYRWLRVWLAGTPMAVSVEELGQGLRKVRRRFARCRPDLERATEAAPAFAGCVAAHGRRLAVELHQALGEIRGDSDETGIHRARLIAKRLRYLLHPLAEECPACAAAVGQLRDLQDQLGELHDRHVMEHLLTEGVAEAHRSHAAQVFRRTLEDRQQTIRTWRPPQLDGLLTLGRRNRMEMAQRYAGCQHDFLHEPRHLAEAVTQALATLERTPAAPVAVS